MKVLLSARARQVALITHLILIAGFIGWNRSFIGFLLVLPLLPALPGLWRGREYTYQWLTLLIVFYCAALLTEGVAMPPRRFVAWPMAAVAAIEFCALALYVRFRGRERSAQKAMSDAASH